MGDIAELDIPNASYGIVFIHFVLHDINSAELPSITRNLVPKLKDNGTLFIREPMRFISRDEIYKLMRQNGLEEVELQVTEIKTQGTVYEGVFRQRQKFSEQKVLRIYDRSSALLKEVGPICINLLLSLSSACISHILYLAVMHSFVTHLLEGGTDLLYIQKLLGHKSSKIMEIYTHGSQTAIGRIISPLDKLDLI